MRIPDGFARADALTPRRIVCSAASSGEAAAQAVTALASLLCLVVGDMRRDADDISTLPVGPGTADALLKVCRSLDAHSREAIKQSSIGQAPHTSMRVTRDMSWLQAVAARRAL